MFVSYGVRRDACTKWVKESAQKSDTMNAQKVTTSCFINKSESSLRTHSQRLRRYASNICDVRHELSSTLTGTRRGNPESSCRENSSGCATCRHVETPQSTRLSGELLNDIEEGSGTLAARDGGWRGDCEVRAQLLARHAGDPLKLKDAIHVTRKPCLAPFVDGLRRHIQCPR